MPAIEIIEVDGLQPMFSADAIKYGDLLFISGCVPMDADGSVVGLGDLEQQTRKVLDNMNAVLQASGTDFAHVLKTTVYVTDITKRNVTHAIRKEIFGDSPPASTMVEVSRFSREGIEIEIDAIVAIPT